MLRYNKFIKENIENKYNYLIDFTYLADNCNEEKIKKICETAKENKFFAIVIPSDFVSYAVGYLNDPEIKVCTAIDFPKGESSTEEKLKITRNTIAEGATEINVVMNIKKLQKTTELEDKLAVLSDKKEEDKEQAIDYKEQITDNIEELTKDIRLLVSEAHRNGIVIKVVVESGVLTISQLKRACKIVEDAGADFVMTSTGKNGVGAIGQLDKVKLMRTFLPDYIQICASGGIRTIEDIQSFFPYVDRIATSVVPKSIKYTAKT